jgi:hypothetical protein
MPMHKKRYPCAKCDGKGTIRGFSHVLHGVCFRCGGTGTVASKPRQQTVKPFTPYQQRLYDALMDDAYLESATYGQLLTLRDFARWPYPCCPELYQTWRTRGEAYFQAAQAERLAAS